MKQWCPLYVFLYSYGIYIYGEGVPMEQVSEPIFIEIVDAIWRY